MEKITIDSDKDIIITFEKVSEPCIIVVKISDTIFECTWTGIVISDKIGYRLLESGNEEHNKFGTVYNNDYDCHTFKTSVDLLKHIKEIQNHSSGRSCDFYVVHNIYQLKNLLCKDA